MQPVQVRAGRPYNAEGRKVTSKGIVIVRKADGKWVGEHRVVLETHLGRTLRSEEKVKWKDGDKTNNAVDNLELWEMVKTWG